MIIFTIGKVKWPSAGGDGGGHDDARHNGCRDGAWSSSMDAHAAKPYQIRTRAGGGARALAQTCCALEHDDVLTLSRGGMFPAAATQHGKGGRETHV